MIFVCLPPPPAIYAQAAQAETPEIAFWKSAIWNRKVVRYRFIGGTTAQRNFVQGTLDSTWNANQGLQFVRSTDTDAEIRISFTPGPAWSNIGTNALSVPLASPTMNLGNLGTGETDVRTVTHEFGHTMGAPHEHQQPNSDIVYDMPRLYEYFAALGYTKEWVDSQIVMKFGPASLFVASPYDEDSVMNYALDPSFLVNPAQASGYNFRPSETDYAWARKVYGPPPRTKAHLPVAQRGW